MLSQLMHTFTIKIDDWLDRKLNRVDPWLQQQATERLNEYKEILEKGGECPYSGIYVSPKEKS